MLSIMRPFTILIILSVTIVQLSSAIKNNAYLLQDQSSYSLVISVTNQNGFKSTANDSQIFTVQAPKYHRVMIVIQQLHLWPEIDKDSQSYLTFLDSDGSSSKKIYGNIDPDETDLVPQYLTGPRSFVSADTSASLVFINLRPDHIIRSKNERRVYAKVVFTAFRDTCSYRSMPPPPKNLTTLVTPSKEVVYRSCTTSSATGKNCIVAKLFCDGSLNCATDQGGSVGVDETYLNCNVRGSRAISLDGQQNSFSDVENATQMNIPTVRRQTTKKYSDDLMKTLIVDQEYDEYFTDLFKSVIIGFLGLCTTCILIAFVVTMFCLKGNRN